MSGAQAKAAMIAGSIGVIAEVDENALMKRYEQGWVKEVSKSLDDCIERIVNAREEKRVTSIGFLGNVVDLWERLAEEKELLVELGSDQTSLHNPWAGGYYPQGMSLEDANRLMVENPVVFKEKVQETLRSHVIAINTLTEKGMYFFDYGNAFLLESKRAGADVLDEKGNFKFQSYVQDIMGPMCFDYGFGPFRWVCSSNDSKDLDISDQIAFDVLSKIHKNSSKEIQLQMQDNINWIKDAKSNNLVVGSQARKIGRAHV